MAEALTSNCDTTKSSLESLPLPVLIWLGNGSTSPHDKNVQLGVHRLSEGRMRKTKTRVPSWYLATLCNIVRALQAACGARDLATQRMVEKALFCFGKSFGNHAA